MLVSFSPYNEHKVHEHMRKKEDEKREETKKAEKMF